MKSKNFWKYFDNSPSGVALTSSIGHGTDSSAYAKIYPQGKIKVGVVCATVGKAVTVNVYTPVAFKIVDATFWASAAIGATPGMNIDVKNSTTSVIAQVTIGTDHVVDRAATVVDSQAAFSVDDNDLNVIVSCSSTGTAVVILDILFT